MALLPSALSSSTVDMLAVALGFVSRDRVERKKGKTETCWCKSWKGRKKNEECRRAAQPGRSPSAGYRSCSKFDDFRWGARMTSYDWLDSFSTGHSGVQHLHCNRPPTTSLRSVFSLTQKGSSINPTASAWHSRPSAFWGTTAPEVLVGAMPGSKLPTIALLSQRSVNRTVGARACTCHQPEAYRPNNVTAAGAGAVPS